MGQPTVTPLVESWHSGGFLVSEAQGHLSRDQITLIPGITVFAGTVLGQVTAGAIASYAPIGNNVGNATLGGLTLNAVETQIGQYAVAYAAATTYTVTAPDGSTANGTNGVAFNALGIAFTLTSGATPMNVGDGFVINCVDGVGNPVATAVANANNVGNSTCGAVTVAGYAPRQGVYSVEYETATNFVVSDPRGIEIGHGVNGTLFNAGGVQFTAVAGTTPMTGGDSFAVTVAPGSGLWRPWDPANTDGSQVVAGILFATRYASLSPVPLPALAITRNAEVNGSELIWANGSNAGQVALGVSQLKALSLIVR